MGRSWVGEAGCACGVWSGASVGRSGRWSVTVDVGKERRERESKGRQTGWLTLAEEFDQRGAFCGVQDGCGSHVRGAVVGVVEEAREKGSGGRYGDSGVSREACDSNWRG